MPRSLRSHDTSQGYPSIGTFVLLAALFSVTAFLIYQPALTGPFISDDFFCVVDNPYVQDLNADSAMKVLDPLGDPAVIVMNYAPVSTLLHSLAWQLFGAEPVGHHVLNLALHIIASLLLVPLFVRSGVPAAAAVLGSAFFLVHPANVEVAAWISQLKTTSALLLSLASLLAFPRHLGLATGFFVLGLLAKPAAAFVLPVVILFAWTRGESIPWKWLAGWALFFVAFAAVEGVAIRESDTDDLPALQDPLLTLRTAGALILRYLVMASTSYGTAAFQELPPVSPLDPWWLGSLAVLALLGWRLIRTLRRREPEAVFWAWAVISFAPVSQIFPFLFPMADRYLYFILPGLMGAALLAGSEHWQYVVLSLEKRGMSPSPRLPLGRIALIAATGLLVLFGLHSHRRALLWRNEALLVGDAAARYPEGGGAHLLQALRAAQAQDAEAAAEGLRGVADQNFVRFAHLLDHPSVAPIRNRPAIREAVREAAADWIAGARQRQVSTQAQLKLTGHAHLLREEYAQAAELFERALRAGGPHDASLRRQLEALRSR
jgi:hypothetical protein